ncbi:MULTISPECIES: hypothetical protein [Rhizobium]|uniref:Uncharacterized protein n=1 Tax=Rhizobium changzhiense TaxID=2692317 RepID=A0A7Z0UI57_9HYPH|nr:MULTISPECIES: hypothetical protein [Rhizobium]MBA5800352.1 hypothetical protein [Rhizobium changzhiense]MCW0018979.1 hypothetical protein [Rhizobium sp. BT-226]NZD66162.1 hypothetical protein [Rhizobium changzhiense]
MTGSFGPTLCAGTADASNNEIAAIIDAPAVYVTVAESSRVSFRYFARTQRAHALGLLSCTAACMRGDWNDAMKMQRQHLWPFNEGFRTVSFS